MTSDQREALKKFWGHITLYIERIFENCRKNGPIPVVIHRVLMILGDFEKNLTRTPPPPLNFFFEKIVTRTPPRFGGPNFF